MIERIIKLLGGFTHRDLERVEIGAKEAKENEVNFLREQLREKDQEIARLSNLIFMRAGFIIPEVTPQDNHPQPINRRLSWREKQRQLELEDAQKAADEIERRWKAKPGAVSNELNQDAVGAD